MKIPKSYVPRFLVTIHEGPHAGRQFVCVGEVHFDAISQMTNSSAPLVATRLGWWDRKTNMIVEE